MFTILARGYCLRNVGIGRSSLPGIVKDVCTLTGKRTLYNSKMIKIAVEGNIGSGKTTFLDHFKTFPEVEVCEEPVERWRNMKGHNLLGMMYEDPHRWSLTFQTYVQLTMVQMQTAKQQRPIRLMERSIYSAKYCFVENLYKRQYMPPSEYEVLTEWFEWLIENPSLKLDLIVYLRTKPENCLKRIKERSRSEETGITVEFLEVLHELHEDWLINEKFKVPAKLLVLDNDLSLQDMYAMFDEKKDEILMKNNSHPVSNLQI